MDAIKAKVVFEGTKTNDYHIFREVVGEPSHGRILGMGIGIKVKDVYGLTSSGEDVANVAKKILQKKKKIWRQVLERKWIPNLQKLWRSLRRSLHKSCSRWAYHNNLT